MTKEVRQSVENGIWLCQSCAKLIDSDPEKYNVLVLYQWKTLAEMVAQQELEYIISDNINNLTNKMLKLEKMMPKLLKEMKEDLKQYPLCREFVILGKKWAYNPSGTELMYFFEDHEELENKVRILENYGVIHNITYTNVDRYCFTEEFVEYLIK